MRDGIAFGKGDFAGSGVERVDVLFTPSRNEFNGRVTAQLQVEALRPAACAQTLPEEAALFRMLLQEMTYLAANDTRISPDMPQEKLPAVLNRLTKGRGVLLLAHERSLASQVMGEVQAREGLRLDAAAGHVADGRGFNTLLLTPDVERLKDVWTDIVLLDGDVLPGEAAAVMAKCPRARLTRLKASPALTALLSSLRMDRDALARLYICLRKGGRLALHQLAEDAGLTAAQVLTGLTALHQAQLAAFSMEPYAVRLLPVEKGTRSNPLDTPLMKYLYNAAKSIPNS